MIPRELFVEVVVLPAESVTLGVSPTSPPPNQKADTSFKSVIGWCHTSSHKSSGVGLIDIKQETLLCPSHLPESKCRWYRYQMM